MLRIVLVRPGCTEFDQQGRIKGTLDIPLSEDGSHQAAEMAQQLNGFQLDTVYSASCRSAQQTAALIASPRRLKVKVLEDLHNVDHGLWHGKLIDEVKQTQPRLYRQGQEHADSICPPRGEPIAAGRERVRRVLGRILKKHRSGELCLVAPEPLASVIDSELQCRELVDLWESECDNGGWSLIEVIPDSEAELCFRGIAAETAVQAPHREHRALTAKMA
jgi:probable phosphoglycerate mutase